MNEGPQVKNRLDRRYLLVRSLLDLVNTMRFEGWTYEDAFVCWAIRLAALEGQQADMVWIMAKTGLSRGTVQRRLRANQKAKTVTVVDWEGKRKHYAHTPLADALIIEYYHRLEAVFEAWCAARHPD